MPKQTYVCVQNHEFFNFSQALLSFITTENAMRTRLKNLQIYMIIKCRLCIIKNLDFLRNHLFLHVLPICTVRLINWFQMYRYRPSRCSFKMNFQYFSCLCLICNQKRSCKLRSCTVRSNLLNWFHRLQHYTKQKKL